MPWIWRKSWGLVRSGVPEEKACSLLYELYLEMDEEFGARQAEFCGALLGACLELGLSPAGNVRRRIVPKLIREISR